MKKNDAQRVTVQMVTGGQVVIVQPVDTRLTNGMNVCHSSIITVFSSLIQGHTLRV
jgi:ribosomal protein L27